MGFSVNGKMLTKVTMPITCEACAQRRFCISFRSSTHVHERLDRFYYMYYQEWIPPGGYNRYLVTCSCYQGVVQYGIVLLVVYSLLATTQFVGSNLKMVVLVLSCMCFSMHDLTFYQVRPHFLCSGLLAVCPTLPPLQSRTPINMYTKAIVAHVNVCKCFGPKQDCAAQIRSDLTLYKMLCMYYATHS